jgi:hypothetical protein
MVDFLLRGAAGSINGHHRSPAWLKTPGSPFPACYSWLVIPGLLPADGQSRPQKEEPPFLNENIPETHAVSQKRLAGSRLAHKKTGPGAGSDGKGRGAQVVVCIP